MPDQSGILFSSILILENREGQNGNVYVAFFVGLGLVLNLTGVLGVEAVS